MGNLKPPKNPIYTVANTTLEVSNKSLVPNSETLIRVTTRDQYGNPIYEPSANPVVTVSGGSSGGWLDGSNMVNNGDGTYDTYYYADSIGSDQSVSLTVNSLPLPEQADTISVNTPRIAFTGNNISSIAPTSRMFDETSGGWDVTGECDAEIGDVTVTFSDFLFSIYIKHTYTTPCDTIGGGTFSFHLNYDSTLPFPNMSQGIIHIYAKQAYQVPIHTWVYKTQSTSPPVLINNNAGLQTIATNDDTAFYILNTDLTFIASDNFSAVGDAANKFQGQFDGNGYTIDGLNMTSGISYKGIFSHCEKAQVANVNVTNITLGGTGFNKGGIAAFSQDSLFIHVSLSGVFNLSGVSYVGGLVGDSMSDDFEYVSFNGTITANGFVGGIAGDGSGSSFKFAKTSGTVNCSGLYCAGVSGSGSDSIKYSFSESEVNSSDRNAGGLAGGYGFIHHSFFIGSVTGTDDYTGGLSGQMGSYSLRGSYSTANVVGALTKDTGALAGTSGVMATNTTAYYLSNATCTNCNMTNGEGKTDSELEQRATFVGWNFKEVWKIDEGVSTPTLRWMEFY